MNPDRPSRDSDFPTPSAVEQRLQQLQPRPVDYDAAALAEEAQRREGPAVTRAAQLAGGRSRWAVVAASWLCGAVAGGLVTFVVVAPNDNENRRGGGIPTGPNGSPLVVEVEESGGGDNDRTPAAEGDMPWSPTERLVAAHLSELDRDQLAKEPPLMAGGYVRLRRTLHTSMRAPIHAKANSSVDQPRAGADGRPALSTDPDSLLRELLGADSDARL